MKEQNYQEKLLIWKKNRIKLREKYSNTPAGFASDQEVEAAYAEWQKEYDGFVESRVHKLSDTVITPESNLCIGREKDLKLLHHMLGREHSAYLYGIGGIGKSTIAFAYMKQYRSQYDHVLFVTAGRNMMQTICDDNAISITNLRFRQKKDQTLQNYYQKNCRS